MRNNAAGVTDQKESDDDVRDNNRNAPAPYKQKHI